MPNLNPADRDMVPILRAVRRLSHAGPVILALPVRPHPATQDLIRAGSGPMAWSVNAQRKTTYTRLRSRIGTDPAPPIRHKRHRGDIVPGRMGLKEPTRGPWHGLTLPDRRCMFNRTLTLTRNAQDAPRASRWPHES